MSIVRKLKRAVRGEVAPKTVVLEALRRSRATLARRGERASLAERDKKPARLEPSFASLSAQELLAHIRSRSAPAFLPGFLLLATSQREISADEKAELLGRANRIVTHHSWLLLGLGEVSFGETISWHRDPLSGIAWPLEYHADLNLMRSDGSDVRVLWELNRVPHLITLARAYSITNDERFSEEFFRQVESWRSQNPYGYGANWNCAMEVALRAMNLLGTFEIFRHSPLLDERKLSELLAIFDQHGTFIRQHLEFSYLTTSNHYLSDVVGLFWLGVMLPELAAAQGWRDFGLNEMLREMDKQVLADGADFEASTGYHRFVLELFLYSFILSRANAIEIDQRHWRKLHHMLRYTRAYLRPDGLAPLIGDSDSGQVFPICRRSGDDHAYVLAIGAAVFNDASLKPTGLETPEELRWILGEQAVDEYQRLEPSEPGSSNFPEAGTHILRDRDLYLLLNTSSAGINGRGSHGHNDALSIEVSACGRPFIVDPGSYVYTADLHERHRFRSTAYHSTVQIDDAEQNTTDSATPFILGDEAHARVWEWEVGRNLEAVMAEHYGYGRLPQAVIHQRRAVINKQQRYWFLSDRLTGEGEHDLSFRFHFAPGLEASVRSDGFLDVCDRMNGARLLIAAYELNVAHLRQPEIEARFSSSDYGAKEASVSARWSLRTGLPFALNFVIVPVCAGEDEGERLSTAMDLEN
jgi:hypothetical protein